MFYFFYSTQHKRILSYTKGYRGRSKNCFTIAIRRLQKAWQYAYRDRKTKKRLWRTLWIQRIQAGVRQYSVRYSRFIRSLKYTDIQLNRKVLSELAATEPFSFKAIVDVTRLQQRQYDSHKNQQQLLQEARDAHDDKGDDEVDVITPAEKAA